MCHVQHSTLSREIWWNISCIVVLPNWYLKNTYQQCQALTQSLELFYKKHGYLKANSKVGWIVHNSPLLFSGVSIPRYSKKKGSNMSNFAFSNLQKDSDYEQVQMLAHGVVFFMRFPSPKRKCLQTAGGYSITNYIPSVSETLENWSCRVYWWNHVKSCRRVQNSTTISTVKDWCLGTLETSNCWGQGCPGQ